MHGDEPSVWYIWCHADICHGRGRSKTRYCLTLSHQDLCDVTEYVYIPNQISSIQGLSLYQCIWYTYEDTIILELTHSSLGVSSVTLNPKFQPSLNVSHWWLVNINSGNACFHLATNHDPKLCRHRTSLSHSQLNWNNSNVKSLLPKLFCCNGPVTTMY